MKKLEQLAGQRMPRTSGKAIDRWRTEMKVCPVFERLALLKRWASVKVQRLQRGRYDERGNAEMRAAANRVTRERDSYGQCWACQEYADLFRHHVIQLQHGGTNYHLNIVRICDECHCMIHPWLTTRFSPSEAGSEVQYKAKGKE